MQDPQFLSTIDRIEDFQNNAKLKKRGVSKRLVVSPQKTLFGTRFKIPSICIWMKNSHFIWLQSKPFRKATLGSFCTINYVHTHLKGAFKNQIVGQNSQWKQVLDVHKSRDINCKIVVHEMILLGPHRIIITRCFKVGQEDYLLNLGAVTVIIHLSKHINTYPIDNELRSRKTF